MQGSGPNERKTPCKSKDRSKKIKNFDAAKDNFNFILRNAKSYLYQEENKPRTTQNIAEMKQLFRGWVAKYWANINNILLWQTY